MSEKRLVLEGKLYSPKNNTYMVTRWFDDGTQKELEVPAYDTPIRIPKMTLEEFVNKDKPTPTKTTKDLSLAFALSRSVKSYPEAWLKFCHELGIREPSDSVRIVEDED